jgi:hypothetical protein
MNVCKITKEKNESKKTRCEKAATRNKNIYDDHLHIKFGGFRENLEDNEWRIVPRTKNIRNEQYLNFALGELALLVLPDHQTLSLALSEPEIASRLYSIGMPAVCVISRDMLPSIRG